MRPATHLIWKKRIVVKSASGLALKSHLIGAMSDISSSSESPSKWSPEKDSYFSLDKPCVSNALAEVRTGRSPLDQQVQRFRVHVQATLARLLCSDWAPPPGYVYDDLLYGDQLCVYKVLPMGEDGWDTVNSIDKLNAVYRKKAKRAIWISGFGCGNNTRSISCPPSVFDRVHPKELRTGLEIIVQKGTAPGIIEGAMSDFMAWADDHIAGFQYGWIHYKDMTAFDRAVKVATEYKDKRYSVTNCVARKYAKRTLRSGGFLLLRQTQSCAWDSCILACSFGDLFHPFFHGFDLWFEKGKRYILICVKEQSVPMALTFFKRASRSSTRPKKKRLFT